jgi:hypothetical protein
MCDFAYKRTEENDMIQKIKNSYEHTIYASYLGYITQAIVNNFAPLLFLTFAATFGLSLAQITMITTVNFLTQLVVDLICAKVIDQVGYRKAIVFAHITAAGGLIGMTVFPALTGNAYMGLMMAVVLYAIGGGIIEVLISPIVEACPTKKKEAAMKAKEKSAEAAIDSVVAQIEQTEEQLADDTELVAVIAAAIAAYEGTSTDGFVVRSIRRR